VSGFESVVGVNPATAIITFLNMMITFLILHKFLFKPVKKMIDDRQNEIDKLYEDANSARIEADELKAEYQHHLDEAKVERDEILRAATAAAQAKEQDIISEARQNAEAIRKKAEADIAQEKKKALNEVKSEISGIAMDIASKVVEKEITAKDHENLVEEFIGKIGENV